MLRTLTIFLFFFSASNLLWGQEVTFKAQASKTEVSVNERFSVQFVLTYGQDNVSVDKPLQISDFGGLQQLAESNINSFQFNNGVVVNQMGLEVILVADQEGVYTIGPATVTVNGKRHKTNPLKITVKKGLKPKIAPGQRLQGAFLTTEVSDENPFLNQEVVLVVKIFARDYSILNRLRNFQEPDFTNLIAKFVSERVPDDEKQVLIGGKTYISKELARYILFPQRSGEIDIEPFALNVLVSGMFGAENVELTSEPISLHVKNLPGGKPANFSGAVGSFNLNTSLSKKEIKANEAVNLDVEITGSGNLNTLKTPEVPRTENIEAYSPKKRNAFEVRPSGMMGKVEETHVLVPQFGGDYTIGPVVFNFFDPKQEKYVTLKTKPFVLRVEGPSAPKVDSASANQSLSDHHRTDSVSNPPNSTPEKLSEITDDVVSSVSDKKNWLWISILVGLIALGLFALWRKKRTPRVKVEEIVSDSQPSKIEIDKKIKELKSLAKEGKRAEFLSLQEDILTKIGMLYTTTNFSNFTEDDVTESLRKSFGNLAENWRSLLLDCKQSKYAFDDTDQGLHEKYNETASLWKALQK